MTPAEMQILVSRTGLVLNPGQVADLVLAWRQVAGLIAMLPRNRPLTDDMALAFRLPPAPLARPVDDPPAQARSGRPAPAKPQPKSAAKKAAAGQRAAAAAKAPAKRAAATPKRPSGSATAKAKAAAPRRLAPRRAPKR
jgi:hypothetical protein